MNKTDFLLCAKLSQQFKYKEMLKIALLLEQEVELNLATLEKIKTCLDPESFLTCQKLLFDEELAKKVLQTKSQCDLISFFDENYPQKLREIYRPPLILFYRGDISLLNSPCVSIVGARMHTDYSREVLAHLVPNLVASNKTIVSGLASGVDSLAHQKTLENHGKTIAVIGNGLNNFYPRQNESLQKRIAREGLVLSEYLPDTPPARFRFPERNRIIAGICDDLIVTEARLKSGSLITANVALQENRNVYAVPGPITSELSAGTNELIFVGATPIINFSLDNFN